MHRILELLHERQQGFGHDYMGNKASQNYDIITMLMFDEEARWQAMIDPEATEDDLFQITNWAFHGNASLATNRFQVPFLRRVVANRTLFPKQIGDIVESTLRWWKVDLDG